MRRLLCTLAISNPDNKLTQFDTKTEQPAHVHTTVNIESFWTLTSAPAFTRQSSSSLDQSVFGPFCFCLFRYHYEQLKVPYNDNTSIYVDKKPLKQWSQSFMVIFNKSAMV